MKKSMIWTMLFLFVMSSYASTADDLWQKGIEAFDRGEWSSAIFYFEKVIELDPQSGDIYRWLGGAYHYGGQNQEAVEACMKYFNFPHPQSTESNNWKLLGSAQEELGQFDAAIASWKKNIELEPDSAIGFKCLSGLYIKKNQLDESLTAAKRAIELKSDSSEAYNYLGVAYRMKKQYDEAEAALKKAIEIDPTKALYHSEIGKLFLEKEDYAKAIAVFNQAIEAEPANTGVNLSRAMTFYIMGKYDDAITALDTILAWQTPLAAISYGFRSSAFRQKGSREAALRDAEKAFSIDPGETWAILSLGAAYLDRGQFDESIKLLSQAKDNVWARIFEATAYAKQGKVIEAQEIYSSISADKLSAKNIPLMSDRGALMKIFDPLAKKHLIKAKSFEAKGQFKQALAELSEALKIADEAGAQVIQEAIFNMARRTRSLELPEKARECALRAEMLVKEGNFDRAAGEYMKAIRIAPYMARLYYNSSLIYAELKKYAEAIRQMSTYLQAAPDASDARAAKDEIIKWKFMMEKEEGN